MKYFIVEKGAPAGPFSVADLMVRCLRPTDLVWAEGMTDWTRADSVEEIRQALYGPKDEPFVTTPPVPHVVEVPIDTPPTPPFHSAPEPTPVDDEPKYAPGETYHDHLIKPDNWLAPAIIATILCCLPFGIVGIVYASKVNTLWTTGRRQEAYEAASSAKKWTLISVGVYVGVMLMYIFLVAIGVMSNL